jgi:large subunit ribosomal protein L22
VKAIARHIRISPKKANLVAGLVRNKKAEEALDILKFTPKKAAGILYKVIKSAIANAENNFKQNRENLIIKEIIVTEGPTLKRSVPVSRGRVHPILKRTSHITVKVEVKDKKEDEKAKKTKPEKKANNNNN